MVFLQKIELYGFKSFAKHITINLSHNITGVVGPNGMGKSNVVDAIKWVLGERSIKTLRGKTQEDIIYHGNEQTPGAEYVSVSLFFDNSIKILHTDLQNVVVTRKLTRGGENEYFINDEVCRLKDIHDMFIDIGVARGSLGIISQGTIQNFIESKPEDRRTIFEEAAGIGLYTKKKAESDAQLARTAESLARINDIINELEGDIKKLNKQVEKAKLYTAKKKELAKLELVITTKDYVFISSKLKEINESLKESKQILTTFYPNVQVADETLKISRDRLLECENEIDTLSNDLNRINEQFNELNIKKITIKNQLENQAKGENNKNKANALKQLITSSEFETKTLNETIASLHEEIENFNGITQSMNTKLSEVDSALTTGVFRINEIKSEIKTIDLQLNISTAQDRGVKCIIDNKNNISGVIDIVSNLYTVEDRYATAISTLLGKSNLNIITKTSHDAINAVNFLKNNKAGKATFLPLDNIQPRQIRPEHLDLVKGKEGFCGIASDLIQYDGLYANAFAYLLGNAIIAEDINVANTLSKYTYHQYRVISLTGDLISPGGAISGGHIQQVGSPVNAKKKLADLTTEFEKLDKQITDYRIEKDRLTLDIKEATNKINEKTILLHKYQSDLSHVTSQLSQYQQEFDLCKNDVDNAIDINKTFREIDEQLSDLNIRKDKITSQLNTNKQNRIVYRANVEDVEQKQHELRLGIDKYREIVSSHETEKVRCELLIENCLKKITGEYKLTIEFACENYQIDLPISDSQARENISILQDELERIGVVNLEAVNELEEKNARYETLKAQKDEVEKAHKTIKDSIEILDKQAKEQFTSTIKNVNTELPILFKFLFGGGTCNVQYTNEDDVLNSGIDVSVSLPGKKITNLNLLSGGEKSLVALSILFSILKFKNFPLIILDESDSALDPANVERYASVINSRAESTQFIIITHRAQTMEKCQMLYGVTMHNNGITELFPVEISQAQAKYSESSK